MKRVSLVRHGESTWNAAKRWQGQSDAPLSEIGEGQAAELASWFAAQSPDRVECSDLQRAANTAQIAGADAFSDPAWRELFVGEWEGQLHREVRERFPEQLQALRRGEPVKLGGGESWFDLRDRTMRALDALVATLPADGHGIVFCHGGVIMVITTALLALDHHLPRRISGLTNTSVTEFGFGADGPRLLRYNDATHLTEREPRARSGVLVARLDTQAGDDERCLTRWPPDPTDATPGVFVAVPARLRRCVIDGLGSQVAAEWLGPLDGPAHVQVRPDVQVLVDYNLRCSNRD